jgi:hypothetical protein
MRRLKLIGSFTNRPAGFAQFDDGRRASISLVASDQPVPPGWKIDGYHVHDSFTGAECSRCP